MKKMNNILKMISQMDANANKIKLAKHEVELGLMQNYDKIYEESFKNYDIFLKADLLIKPNLDKAQEEALKSMNALKKYVSQIQDAKKMVVTLKQTANDLGIDLKDSKLRSIQNIEQIEKVDLNDLENWIQSYNTFLKVQEPVGG
jgi:hypothetical protein